MKNAHKILITAFAEFVFLTAATLAVPAIITIDTVILEHGVSEISLTEIVQEILLCISALLFGIRARRSPYSRGFLALVSGFFSCMLIREMDAFFDHLVYHGFWFWPAICVAGGAILYAFLCRGTVVAPLVNFLETTSCYHIVLGLLIVLVLSRTLGSGSLLWKPIMGEVYSSEFKAALQEGLELFGYMLICYGSVLFLHQKEAFHIEPGSTYQHDFATAAVSPRFLSADDLKHSDRG